MDKSQGKHGLKNRPENEGNDVCFLTLHNDDVHSFDYVIGSLMEVLDHSAEQAEQCTYLTHFTGICRVKSGTRPKLEPMREQLVRKGLDVRLNRD